MPARPLSDDTLQLIDAVREALAEQGSDVEEKRMFGCHVFMVDGKMCLGVEHDELLVRLPPATHAEVAETPDVRPLSSRGLMDGYFLVGPAAYATRTSRWPIWSSPTFPAAWLRPFWIWRTASASAHPKAFTWPTI